MRAHVAFDRPQHAPLGHALEIDLIDPSGTRVAPELSAALARALVQAIARALERGEVETGERVGGSSVPAGSVTGPARDATVLPPMHGGAADR